MRSDRRPAYHLSRFLTLETQGQGFYRLGAEVAVALAGAGTRHGTLSLFIAHTSASLTVQENADPAVLSDLLTALRGFAPDNGPYRHTSEGPDDMPAHIKTMLTATSLTLPVRAGRLALGTWQEVYLIEHRKAPHTRRLDLDYVGSLEG